MQVTDLRGVVSFSFRNLFLVQQTRASWVQFKGRFDRHGVTVRRHHFFECRRHLTLQKRETEPHAAKKFKR